MCLTYNCSGHNCHDKGIISGSYIADRTFKINISNITILNPKGDTQYDHQIQDQQCLKEDMTLSGCKLIEQSNGVELVQIKETLQKWKINQ